MPGLLLWFSVFSLASTLVFAVDRSKFRKCGDTGFCRRHRNIRTDFSQQYQLDSASIREHEGKLLGTIIGGPINTPSLYLSVSVNNGGSVRVKITESVDRWQPLDLLAPISLISMPFELLAEDDKRVPTSIQNRPKGTYVCLAFYSSILVLQTSPAPLLVELYTNDVLQVSANSRSMFHFETRRNRQGEHLLSHGESNEDNADRHQGKEVVDYGEDGLAIYADGTREEKVATAAPTSSDENGEWEETFNGHVDSKPLGPMSVGCDFSFPSSTYLYGIPEHASSLVLKTTTKGTSVSTPPAYSEPYRLYTLDVFDYELDESMALYGNIPLMLAHGKTNGQPYTTGIFWFNPSETFIDISLGVRTAASGGVTYPESHWISESGAVDFFLLPGPSPAAVYSQYTYLTGRQQLPPLFALGYHQCRWNYRDERDVATVEGMFEQLDFPVDVIWLDIEHTNGKRYFTWDKQLFPNPIEMQQNVSRHGRKMVTIVDPHIKRDDNYAIHKEATEKGLYIRTAGGKSDFDGWCWPGSSSYLDFTDARVRAWWAERFSLTNYEGSTMDLFTWNDMNEPSVFNGPEVSMQKDAVNLAGIEHREWHNLYGLYMQKATSEGLTLRDPNKALRPFVLSRSFWAGSQKYGAIWTGDNGATWGHLKAAAPMLLSINLAGLSFAGADVGGFFGEPGPELFTRWYQAGAFTPFFRGHAHHDTKRREPWTFGEPYTTILRATAMIRYSLLPYWYAVFHEAYTTGMPVMRALFSEFPEDESVWTVEDQWMVGSALMVKPVTDAGAGSVNLYLPGNSGWYDFYNLAAVAVPSAGRTLTVPAPLDKIPVFVRGGSILPRKMRLRRSSQLMFFDPFTLIIAPDKSGRAYGQIYLDDEKTLAHETSQQFALRSLSYEGGLLKCVAASTSGGLVAPNRVERVVIANQLVSPKKVVLNINSKEVKEGGSVKENELTEISFLFDPARRIVTVKKPDMLVTENWELQLIYE